MPSRRALSCRLLAASPGSSARERQACEERLPCGKGTSFSLRGREHLVRINLAFEPREEGHSRVAGHVARVVPRLLGIRTDAATGGCLGGAHRIHSPNAVAGGAAEKIPEKALF